LQPVQLIVGTWKSFITARVSFRRLDALLNAYPERVGQTVNEAPHGQVVLQGLVAKASGREQPILKGLNAEFAAGEVVVILGPSGSGKSTLARCLVGIWSDTEGAVLLDGTPIGSWDRHELGPHLGYLPQDVELFDGTIAENIARFSEVDPSKVIEAAQRAGIHEMILHFPQGYDTPMGLAGGLLSGGQRQRIALARAMYGNPALLVLDEPNANLDDLGEVALVNAVQHLKSLGRTVILISHRTSIVGVADRLMIMANGQIQMQGPRAEVLATLQRAQSAAASAHPVS
jgi:ATP-binding cassette subfamily C exporter for protease/lipase